MKKSIVVIILISIIIFIGIIFITSRIEVEKDKNEENIGAVKKENENTKEIINEIAEPIKWIRYTTTTNADKKTIKSHMNKYDDNTYILPIRDIKTFEKIQNTLGIKATSEDGNVEAKTFEEFDYDILLIFIDEQENWTVKNVLPYKTKIVIEFGKPEFSTSTVKYGNMFCVGIPRLFNNDNVEIFYEGKEILVNLKDDVEYRISECYINNLQEFDNIYFLDDGQGLYYTDIIDINKYNELIEKLEITVGRTIPQKTLEDKDIILVFKRTKNKLEIKNSKYSKDGILMSIKETDKEYGKGISGMIIVLERGKHKKYNFYLEE